MATKNLHHHYKAARDTHLLLIVGNITAQSWWPYIFGNQNSWGAEKGIPSFYMPLPLILSLNWGSLRILTATL